MKNKLIFIALLVSLSFQVPTTPAPSGEKKPSSHLFSLKNAMYTSVIIMGGIITYPIVTYIYGSYRRWVDNKINDFMVDSLTAALLPHNIVNKMDPLEKETTLRKKAYLIALRKRIIITLKSYLTNTTLSPEHRSLLKAHLHKAKLIFIVLDIFRRHNPYENEYKTASFIDTFIESSIINSYLLSTKPEAECTEEELNLRKLKKQNSEFTIQRVIANLSSHINPLLEPEYLCDMFLL